MRIKDLEPSDIKAVSRWFNRLVKQRPVLSESGLPCSHRGDIACVSSGLAP